VNVNVNDFGPWSADA